MLTRVSSIKWLLLGGFIALFAVSTLKADVDLPSKFGNTGSIADTRHNLSQSAIGAGYVNMNPYRNDYVQVCVYCHTPHGANSTLGAPLWNRTYLSGTVYDTYDTLGTSTLTDSKVLEPGVNSLSCLSCHDGTIAVDSIINMPGSGGYSLAQESSADISDGGFLDSWTNPTGPDASVHAAMDGVNEGLGCLACHSSTAGIIGAGATDFKLFAIGTDLTNDHPVGIEFPLSKTGIGGDFVLPDVQVANRYAILNDDDGDGRPDKDEIRLYDTGQGYEVECASCHDPHGVDDGEAEFVPTFLRIRNAGSALCQTCHNK